MGLNVVFVKEQTNQTEDGAPDEFILRLSTIPTAAFGVCQEQIVQALCEFLEVTSSE